MDFLLYRVALLLNRKMESIDISITSILMKIFANLLLPPSWYVSKGDYFLYLGSVRPSTRNG